MDPLPAASELHASHGHEGGDLLVGDRRARLLVLRDEILQTRDQQLLEVASDHAAGRVPGDF